MPDAKTVTDAPVDLTSLDVIAAADDGAVLELLHPVSGQTLGVQIRLIGADSENYRKAMRSAAAKRVNSRSRTALSPEELDREALNILAQATLGWEGVVIDGETVSFSRDQAVGLYKRFPWIREQVEAFVNDRGNFLLN